MAVHPVFSQEIGGEIQSSDRVTEGSIDGGHLLSPSLQGKYTIHNKESITAGSDGIGTVEETDSEVTRMKGGDKVAWLMRRDQAGRG